MAKEDYEVVIGLEVHAELSTKTKIFCNCSTEFGGMPNTHTCPICMAMPGTLPVLNEKVVEYAVKQALQQIVQFQKTVKTIEKIISTQTYQNLTRFHNLTSLFATMVT